MQNKKPLHLLPVLSVGMALALILPIHTASAVVNNFCYSCTCYRPDNTGYSVYCKNDITNLGKAAGPYPTLDQCLVEAGVQQTYLNADNPPCLQ